MSFPVQKETRNVLKGNFGPALTAVGGGRLYSKDAGGTASPRSCPLYEPWEILKEQQQTNLRLGLSPQAPRLLPSHSISHVKLAPVDLLQQAGLASHPGTALASSRG